MDSPPDTKEYPVPEGMTYATDTVTRVSLETTTIDGQTYRHKASIVPFVHNPATMPEDLIPKVEPVGKERYAMGVVRSPKGLGDVHVQDWVRPMLICPTPEFDWEVPVLPVAINVSQVTGGGTTNIMCSDFSCGDSHHCYRCAAAKSEANIVARHSWSSCLGMSQQS